VRTTTRAHARYQVKREAKLKMVNPVDSGGSIRPARPSVDQSKSAALEQAERATPRETRESQSGSGDAEVTLTRVGSTLLALQRALRELPDVDQQRVDAVRQALADDSYQIDAADIADKLLQFERGQR
jgi:negative regulator of flagellin synthesis FlgM